MTHIITLEHFLIIEFLNAILQGIQCSLAKLRVAVITRRLILNTCLKISKADNNEFDKNLHKFFLT